MSFHKNHQNELSKSINAVGVAGFQEYTTKKFVYVLPEEEYTMKLSITFSKHPNDNWWAIVERTVTFIDSTGYDIQEIPSWQWTDNVYNTVYHVEEQLYQKLNRYA